MTPEQQFAHDFEDNILSIMDEEVEDEYIMPKDISLEDILTEDVNCLSILLTKIKISELDSIWYYAVRNNMYKEQCYRNNMDYIKAFKERFINGEEEEEEEETINPDEDDYESGGWYETTSDRGNTEQWWSDPEEDDNTRFTLYRNEIIDGEEDLCGHYGICKVYFAGYIYSDDSYNREEVYIYKHFVKYDGERQKSFWSKDRFTINNWRRYNMFGLEGNGFCRKNDMIKYLNQEVYNFYEN